MTNVQGTGLGVFRYTDIKDSNLGECTLLCEEASKCFAMTLDVNRLCSLYGLDAVDSMFLQHMPGAYSGFKATGEFTRAAAMLLA